MVFSPGLDQCVRHPWLKSSAMPEHTVSVSHAIPFLVELFSRRSSIRVALEVLILKVISQRQKVEGFFFELMKIFLLLILITRSITPLPKPYGIMTAPSKE